MEVNQWVVDACNTYAICEGTTNIWHCFDFFRDPNFYYAWSQILCMTTISMDYVQDTK